MKKIGIITTYFASNYGAALQPFALMRTLESMGYDVEMIPYKQEDIYNGYNPLYYKKYIRKNVIRSIEYLWTLSYLLPRERKFQKYISNYITKGFKKLSKEVPFDKDYYFIGSDQLWRTFGPDEHFDDVYCGYFPTKEGAKKIAYAVSGDHLNLNRENKDYFKKAFSNFDFISVRENKRAEEFKKFYIEKEIETVADPTILAHPSLYKEILHINPLPGIDYVFFYFIREGSYNFIDKIYEYARKRNAHLLIFSEGFNRKLLKFSSNNKDVHYLPSAGEEEFLGAMQNAIAVFTASFHGNVFATIYHKNLFTLILEDGGDNRAIEFMKVAGINGRKITQKSPLVETPINWDTVDSNLEAYRCSSMKFIKKALEI